MMVIMTITLKVIIIKTLQNLDIIIIKYNEVNYHIIFITVIVISIIIIIKILTR